MKNVRLTKNLVHYRVAMKITRFEDIEAWKAARKLGQSLSTTLRSRTKFPDSDLADQLLRCAGSIMANIVEGFDSGSDRELVRFLKIAYRSGSELQSHLYSALDQRHLNQATFDSLYAQARETKALIGGFVKYLKSCR